MYILVIDCSMHNKNLEDVTAPTALLGILGKVDLVFVAVNIENVQLALPLVDDFGDRYYSNLEKQTTFRLLSPSKSYPRT